jgi:hypothetical protein
VSQPVRISSMKFRRMTDNIIRSKNYIRIRDEWMEVSECTKENI